MGLSKRKKQSNVSRSAAVIGDSVTAIQAALALAQMGIGVKLIVNSPALGLEGVPAGEQTNAPDRRYLWPLLLQTVNHPDISFYSNATVEGIEGKKGDFKLKVLQRPRYINEELCTACGRCKSECSVRITSLLGGQKITRSAIHAPLLEEKSVPSAYLIEKNGFAPCRVACPLGINVQGFVSLLSKGKVDSALALINESAPFAGILGRVCRHPCEEKCNRSEVDQPVFIRGLHRFSADNAPGGIKYTRKAPARSRQDKVAIVGSGPGGLTAAWELTRRGYPTTVFEAHAVIGGTVATGIPRFRLPKEVREREIEAIKALGVDIRTGITVGRDVTFAYLKERGYKSFFLAIGAQQNNKLKIPGEGLEGVVDCMSLLLTLNLMVDSFVGANIVIIGDGNSAVDSARAAIRRNKGNVKILSWTIPEEVTANEEEVKEALQEGVVIEHCVAPVEILGKDGKVVGIRCQKTRLTEKLLPDGRHLPEPIPGTDFVRDADHVVVAIGQSPNALQLNLEGLVVDKKTGVIKVNPLTMETGVPGFFAGGDCITGPNNVVEAMAAGLRAAESIDRYLQGKDLEAERTLEPPPVAEIDIDTIEVARYKRAEMPLIRAKKRLATFEETTLGLSPESAKKETMRCLNCAMCSQCLECTTVCGVNALFHDDIPRAIMIEAEAVLEFPSNGPGRNQADYEDLSKALAMAVETAIELKPEATKQQAQDTEKIKQPVAVPAVAEKDGAGRIGVFLCRCGDSISSIIDFRVVSRKLSELPGVVYIDEIAQSCTEEGAGSIAEKVGQEHLDRVVLAACRCCNLEQVCYSCTDRRNMCLQNVYQHLILPTNTVVEFCNIREQCAWVHQDDPKNATKKALQIISSGVMRAGLTPSRITQEHPIKRNALIIGGDAAGTASAKALASRGYEVTLISREAVKTGTRKPHNLGVKAWPDSLKLTGSPGNYEVVLKYGSSSEAINAGAIATDADDFSKIGDKGLLSRILSHRKEAHTSSALDDRLREITIGEMAGLFLFSNTPSDDPKMVGLATAARISAYLEQENVRPRATAVDIVGSKCRGCGDCADICSYIEMHRQNGLLYASVDKALCLGCGACVAICSAGAISQPSQSDRQIISTLTSMLQS